MSMSDIESMSSDSSNSDLLLKNFLNDSDLSDNEVCFINTAETNTNLTLEKSRDKTSKGKTASYCRVAVSKIDVRNARFEHGVAVSKIDVRNARFEHGVAVSKIDVRNARFEHGVAVSKIDVRNARFEHVISSLYYGFCIDLGLYISFGSRSWLKFRHWLIILTDSGKIP
ncbi:hypothetical protein RIR_jg4112.t1 [Rhizophagus irregularis DAOM 181602=DAOM 197198]|nr:hypothetical protein RIR_jg4112.t1 [Rhizophagus irregularis DAOM 181602=DAOM 197198]